MKPVHIILVVSLIVASALTLNKQLNSNSVDTRTLTGVLKATTFPVKWFGPAPQVGQTKEKYMNISVLSLETRDNETVTGEYLLYYGGETEMIPVGSGGVEIGGLTIDEINYAHKAQASVDVTGKVEQLAREGVKYNVIQVDSINIPDRSTIPLVVYHLVLEEGRYIEDPVVNGAEPISLPCNFSVGREVNGNAWKETRHIFRILLNEGDRVRLCFDSEEPIHFSLYAPSEAYPEANSTRWGVEVRGYVTSSLDNVLEVNQRGQYSILLEANKGFPSNVTLNAFRLPISQEILFTMRGSHGSSSGGMGTGSLSPEPLPNKVTIGRTWSLKGAWTDHSYTYTSKLEAGNLIHLQYNATEKVNMIMTLNEIPLINLDEYYFDETLTLNESGSLKINFSVKEPKTAIVSARCNLLSGEKTQNKTVIFYKYQEDTPRFPPRFNITTVDGTLLTLIPSTTNTITSSPEEANEQNATVLGIKTYNGTIMILHLGVTPELIHYPDGGYTMIGHLTLYDIVKAYENHLEVEIEGFPFTPEGDDSEYNMFHINSITVKDPTNLQLSAKHSYLLVNGPNNDIYGDNEPTDLPVTFKVGFDNYEEGYGNPEHFYHIYLRQGETIQYQMNATGTIDYRAYLNYPPSSSNSIIPFSIGNPSDYFIEDRSNHTEGFHTAEATGYYTFAFKAWGGLKADVMFDCTRVEIVEGK